MEELLKKYMQLVIAVEGVSFVDCSNDSWFDNAPKFTKEEIDHLKKVEAEILRDQ